MTPTVPGGLLIQSLTIKLATDTTGSVQTGDSMSESVDVSDRRAQAVARRHRDLTMAVPNRFEGVANGRPFQPFAWGERSASDGDSQ